MAAEHLSAVAFSLDITHYATMANNTTTTTAPTTAPARAPQRRPGGAPQRQRNRSRFGMQMFEKQNLKKIFGIRETQLRRYFAEADRSIERTGNALVSLLERRLDNAVFRAGWAESRAHARQMTTHRLFAVNGRPVDVPSYQLKIGDVVSVKEGKRGKAPFMNFEKRLQNAAAPAWILLNPQDYSFKVTALPTVDDAALGVDIQAIVEFFAR